MSKGETISFDFYQGATNNDYWNNFGKSWFPPLGFKQTTSGGISGGALVPPLSTETIVYHPRVYPYSEPCTVGIAFRYESSQLNIARRRTLVQLRSDAGALWEYGIDGFLDAGPLVKISADEAGIFLRYGSIDYGLDAREGTPVPLIDKHWYSLRFTRGPGFHGPGLGVVFECTVTVDDLGSDGKQSPVPVLSIPFTASDPRGLGIDGNFSLKNTWRVGFSAERSGGVVALDNFEISSAPVAAPKKPLLLVYRYSRINVDSPESKQSGYLVLDVVGQQSGAILSTRRRGYYADFSIGHIDQIASTFQKVSNERTGKTREFMVLSPSEGREADSVFPTGNSLFLRALTTTKRISSTRTLRVAPSFSGIEWDIHSFFPREDDSISPSGYQSPFPSEDRVGVSSSVSQYRVNLTFDGRATIDANNSERTVAEEIERLKKQYEAAGYSKE